MNRPWRAGTWMVFVLSAFFALATMIVDDWFSGVVYAILAGIVGVTLCVDRSHGAAP